MLIHNDIPDGFKCYIYMFSYCKVIEHTEKYKEGW